MESVVDKWLEKIMAEAKAKGRAEGRAEGKREAAAELIKGLMETSHKSFDDAADALNIPLEQRPAIRKYLGL